MGSVVAAHSTGSVVVAQGPGCPVACGILLDQRLNLCPLRWQADSLPMGHEESPRDGFYYNIGALKLDLKSILVYVFCMIYWVFTKRKNFDFIKTDDLSLKIAFTIFMPAKEIIFFELCIPFSLLLHSMSLYTRLQLSY